MTKYRTKQSEVEAARLVDGPNGEQANAETIAWCGATATDSHIEGKLFHVPSGRPNLMHGVAWAPSLAKIGDWIVKTANEFVVLTDAEFRAAYEEIKPVAEVKPVKAPEVAKLAETTKQPTATVVPEVKA